MTTAIYAGTFDPISLGHRWVIEKSATIFEKVIIVLATNSEKQGVFPPKQRKELVDHIIKTAGLAHKVEVVISTNAFVANVAKQFNATHLIRGIRDSKDFEYEKTIASVNRDINSSLETVYLIPPDNISKISASLLKGFLTLEGKGKAIRPYVDFCVYNALLATTYTKQLNEMHYTAIERYSEVNRSYHNLTHIVDCVSVLCQHYSHKHTNKSVVSLLDYPVYQAILYHDVVYNPTSKTNEEDSCKFFESIYKFPGNLTEVKSLIMVTKNHFDAVTDDEKLIVDIDLSILGRDADDYAWYCKCLYDEYLQEYPEEFFFLGRLTFLTGFVEKIQKRGCLYNIQWFRDQFERQAMENIHNEIEDLRVKVRGQKTDFEPDTAKG